jgi:AraC family transcriptional regulator
MRDAPDLAYAAIEGASVVHCRLPAWAADEHVSSSATSSIGLSFSHQACVVATAGLTRERLVCAGSAVVVGGQPIDWLRVDQPSELVEVRAGPELRRRLADELRAEPHADLADVAFASDPVVWTVAARLRVLVRRADPRDTLEADWLVRRLYAHVLVTTFGGALREKGDGALDARRLARVVDHIDAHLGDALSLEALADVGALSVFHFQRSFRRATGCSPHRYVAMRRAEEARRRLQAGEHPAAVAAALGYRNDRSMRKASSDQRACA